MHFAIRGLSEMAEMSLVLKSPAPHVKEFMFKTGGRRILTVDLISVAGQSTPHLLLSWTIGFVLGEQGGKKGGS